MQRHARTVQKYRAREPLICEGTPISIQSISGRTSARMPSQDFRISRLENYLTKSHSRTWHNYARFSKFGFFLFCFDTPRIFTIESEGIHQLVAFGVSCASGRPSYSTLRPSQCRERDASVLVFVKYLCPASCLLQSNAIRRVDRLH